MLARSGRMTQEELREAFRENTAAYENNTGRLFQSATQSSYDTWNQGPFGRGKGAGVRRTISYYRQADANPGGRILPTEADMSLLNVVTCFGVAATLAALMAPVLVLAAQGQASPCPDQGRSGRPSHCEIREQMLSALGGPLAVDSSPNGGITVHGWNRQEIQLRAKVMANADTQQEADALAGQIRVLTDGGRIRSDGPRVTGHGGWSVSFDLMVPIDSGLDLQSRNGGISLTDVRGRIELATTNGGITLKNVNGDVRGHTTNGGVKVELSGDGWHGQGLDVRTENGGAQIVVPDGYSAHLEASTKNGGVRCAFPVTVQGTVGRELSTDLGQGGAPIIIKTINGAVTIARQ